jgi:hypothetical protein
MSLIRTLPQPYSPTIAIILLVFPRLTTASKPLLSTLWHPLLLLLLLLLVRLILSLLLLLLATLQPTATATSTLQITTLLTLLLLVVRLLYPCKLSRLFPPPVDPLCFLYCPLTLSVQGATDSIACRMPRLHTIGSFVRSFVRYSSSSSSSLLLLSSITNQHCHCADVAVCW